jgi:hypothetical protein
VVLCYFKSHEFQDRFGKLLSSKKLSCSSFGFQFDCEHFYRSVFKQYQDKRRAVTRRVVDPSGWLHALHEEFKEEIEASSTGIYMKVECGHVVEFSINLNDADVGFLNANVSLSYPLLTNIGSIS